MKRPNQSLENYKELMLFVISTNLDLIFDVEKTKLRRIVAYRGLADGMPEKRNLVEVPLWVCTMQSVKYAQFGKVGYSLRARRVRPWASI